MSNKPTNFPNGVESAQGFTGPVTGAVTGNVTGDTTGAHNGTVGATTPAAGSFTTIGASGAVTLDGAVTLGNAGADAVQVNGTVTILLASIPEYADQAAAAAALAPGALFRFATTGALGVALT